jgi:hypothetical protein
MHAMKAYEEVEAQFQAFLISALNGTRRRLRTQAALFPGKEPSYPRNSGRINATHDLNVLGKQKHLALPRIEPRFV